MDAAFTSQRLNEQGIAKSQAIRQIFDGTVDALFRVIDNTGTREWSLVKTKLEEACFYAQKNLASKPEHQVPAGHGQPIPSDMTMAKIAEGMFNAYNEQGPNPWKTFDGRDVPRWDAITDQVRAKWIAAATKFVLPNFEPVLPPFSETSTTQQPGLGALES